MLKKFKRKNNLQVVLVVLLISSATVSPEEVRSKLKYFQEQFHVVFMEKLSTYHLAAGPRCGHQQARGLQHRAGGIVQGAGRLRLAHRIEAAPCGNGAAAH
jgi:hypothetical protein